MDGGYRMPPDSLAELVDAPVTPSFSIDPAGTWALLVKQPSLAPIEEIARAEVKLGGIRFDPALWTPSHLAFGLAPALRRIRDGATPVQLGEDDDLHIRGLPSGAGVRWMSWRPSGGAVAFLLRPEKTSAQLEVWVAEFDPSKPGKSQSCDARPLLPRDRVPQAVLGCPYKWTPDGRLLCRVVPVEHGECPRKPLAPLGPSVQTNIGTLKPARTYADMLKSQHDEDLFTYYLTAELLLLDPKSASSYKTLGPSEGTLLRAFSPSPDNSCVLCTIVAPAEFSYLVPYHRFGHTVEAWPLQQQQQQRRRRLVVAYNPLQESIPIGFDARPTGVRNCAWHPCFPSTLIWTEALDGGDPKSTPPDAVTMYRDMMYTEAMTAGPKGGLERRGKRPLIGLQSRWAGWWFTDEGVGLIKEKRWKDRTEIAWRISPVTTASNDGESEKVKLWSRQYQDQYASPGSPEECRNARDQLVLQTLKVGGSTSTGAPVVCFMGNGASNR
jgi:hypothetical protein